jgi:hypothetical protein
MGVITEDYSDYKHLMPLIELTPQQVDDARELGRKRSESYTREGYGTERGNTLPNVHTCGVLAEMAVAEYYGARLDRTIIDGGDNGSDLIIGDIEVDVKANRRDRNELLVKEHKADADVFILCNIETEHKIRLVGYAKHGKVIDRLPRYYPTDIKNYVLHWTELERVPQIE